MASASEFPVERPNSDSLERRDESRTRPEGVRSETPAKVLPEFETMAGTDDLEEFDPESIVEAAEALLREGQPHDFELLVIGSGPGGYNAALRAAQLGARVGLVEAAEPGGTSVNHGGAATLALLESAALMRTIRRAAEFGIELEGGASANLEVAQNRKRAIVWRLREEVRDSLQDAGVRLIQGRAKFVEEHTLEVDDGGIRTRYNAVHILIAAGGMPRRPIVPGIELAGVLTTDEALELSSVPSKIVVLGAGVLAVEFATMFAELGSETVLLHGAERLLPKEDPDLGWEVQMALQRCGVRVELKATIESIDETHIGLEVHYTKSGGEFRIETPLVLIAGGRQPNVAELGLTGVGIRTDGGKIVVDEDFGTSVSGVYAIGDCIRSLGWAHQAAAEGRRVAERILGDPAGTEPILVPRVYRTHPEAAAVGMTSEQAADQGFEFSVSRYSLEDSARPMASGESQGFVELVFELASERLLGCQIVSPHAGEIIHLACQALRAKWTLQELITGVHIYPTYGEALAAAALAARRGLPGDW